MIDRTEGLTKTYNRFHARGENAPDIARLRALHAEIDAAVLRAYGWDDLAERAAPEFIEQDADEGKTSKTQLDWPAEFKDEVLAQLLALNAERAAAEKGGWCNRHPRGGGRRGRPRGSGCSVEGLAYEYLEDRHPGWEINDGAFGTFVFNFAHRTISLEHRARFTDVDIFTSEF